MTIKKKPFFFVITFVLFAVDIYFALNAAPSPVSAKLGLSDTFVFRALLNLSFTIPLFTSFYLGLDSGILLLRITKFRLFAKSILMLTLVLVIGAIIGAIRTHFFSSDIFGGYKFLTILTNFLYSWGYLVCFIFLLFSINKIQSTKVRKWNIAVSLLIALFIGTFYCAIILTNPDRLTTSSNYIKPTHFLPDTLIVATIILPTVLGWFFAILAAFGLADEYGNISASLHEKEGFKKILYGTVFIIFSVVALQAILSIGTTRFLESGLMFTLAMIYTFIAVLTIGNFFILKGAEKLSQS